MREDEEDRTDDEMFGHNKGPSALDLMQNEVAALAERANKLPAKIGSDEDVSAYTKVVKSARDLAKKVDQTRKDENEPFDRQIKANNTAFAPLKARMERVVDVLSNRIGAYEEDRRAEERRKLAAEAAEREEAARIERQKLEDARREREENGEEGGIEDEIEFDRVERMERQANAAYSRADRAGTGPSRNDAGTVGTKKGYDFKVEDWKALDLNEFKDSFTVAEKEKAIRAHVRKHKDTQPLKGVRIYETSKVNIR